MKEGCRHSAGSPLSSLCDQPHTHDQPLRAIMHRNGGLWHRQVACATAVRPEESNMARIRIEALDRPTEQTLDAQQARGVVGAGPHFIRGVYTGVPGSRLPYIWTPGVSSFYGGTSHYYN